MAINDFFVWGKGGAKLTPDQIERERQIADALIKQGVDFSPVGHWTQGAARMANALVGNLRQGRADRAQREGIAGATDAFNNAGIADLLAGGNATVNQPQSSSQAATTSSSYQPTGNDVRDGIVATANSLGIDPLDLATAISYETGGTFDPTKSGPTTKWGTHRGLIQFGEPQAKQYGIDWSNPVASQLGENGAVANYLRDTGVKPGMGLLDVYSAINAGGVGRYNRSDTAAGGAPGTVRDKVEQQMAGHRRKAQALLGGGGEQSSGSRWVNRQNELLTNTPANGNWMDVQRAGLMEQTLADARSGDPVAQAVLANSQQPVQVASADPNYMPQASSEVTMSPVAQALTQPAQAVSAPIQQQAQAAPQSGANLQGLIQLANNPFLNDAQRGMVNTALQYQMQQNDPVRALQMQQIQQGLRKGDLEIAAMQQPAATKYGFTTLPDGTVVRTNEATGEVIPAYEGAPKPSTDIQNYEYARANGYQGSFADYQQEVKRAGAQTTNIDLGNIPAGYEAVRDDSGRVTQIRPLPGSPDYVKAQAAEKAKGAQSDIKSQTANVVTEDIDRALDIIEKSSMPTTGAIGSMISSIGGTASNDLKNLITTVQANAGFDKLQAMRDASPTGGALGAISERELTYLQSTIGSLDQSQTKDQLIYNLKRVLDAYSQIIHGEKPKDDKGGWQEINGVKIRVKQ